MTSIFRNLSGYSVEQELTRDERHSVYRAIRLQDRIPVLLKIRVGPDTSEPGLEPLEREYKLVKGLSEEAVLRPLELAQADGKTVLVMEDPGGQFLSFRPGALAMKTLSFLESAIPIVEALSRIHQYGIVHRNIKPSSVYINRISRKVRITGFENATRLPRTTQTLALPRILDDSLAYLAPERTGRMNRSVDRRTDLYSLGVIFYRMLTGRLPFEATDPLDMMHCHMARTPDPPAAIVKTLPQVISDIVMKLLSKAAEDRYHEAAGLNADLQRCLGSLQDSAQVDTFPLAQEDQVSRLQIPEKLYGREREIEELLAAFRRIATGGTELMTVAGYSGIGKTSLVLEIQRPIHRAKGYFVSGKFDQLNRDQPYSALIQALSGLVNQILTESAHDIAALRKRFAKALGSSAQVIIDVVPELELVIGPQPAVQDLEPAENQNRLKRSFQRFIAAVARPAHPLVVFLDDLQWADTASLGLIEALLTGDETDAFMLIGAYRDNEVDSRHPLLLTIGDIHETTTAVSCIVLGPLSPGEMEVMLADTFGCDEDHVRDLAELVYDKTRGNPFFAHAFLDAAFNNGLIRHRSNYGWSWNTEQIRRVQPTDNVVDLLSTRIDSMGRDNREVLQIAACVGSRFDLTTLATVRKSDTESILQALLPPLKEGLIESDDEEVFAFFHDRIQEAAYRRLDPATRTRIHFSIGTLLLKQHASDQRSDRLFEITDHLNEARALLRDREAQRRLARLNLQAGEKAFKSAAFRAAKSYFSSGIVALGRRTWSEDHELAYALYLGRAQGAYLCAEFGLAAEDVGRLLRRAKSGMERAQAYALRIVQHENSARFSAAVAAGKSALGLFGIQFSERGRATQAAIDEAMVRIRRLNGNRPVRDLVNLPSMKDSEMRMSMRLLMTLWAPAYISGDKPLTVLISARMVELSLQFGNTQESAYGYVTHAITLGAVMHDYRAAYEFGLLALDVNKRFDDLKARAKVNHMFSCYIGFWRRPISECFTYSREAYSAGLESGDFIYAAYGCFHESWHAMYKGWELGRFNRFYAEKLAFLERIKNRSFYDAHQLMLHWGLALQGRTLERGSLSSEQFDENVYLERYRNFEFFTAFYLIAKLNLLYTLGDYSGARSMARQVERVALGVRGMIWDAWRCFYHALSLAAADPRSLSTRARGKLDQLIEQMGLWAGNSPHNFAHQHRLLKAERDRIDGRTAEAIENYETAIAGAADAGFIHHQALAKELYAGFWLNRGNRLLARPYMIEAAADYAFWGAAAKVQHLAEVHHDLMGPAGHHDPAETVAQSAKLDVLDTATVVRATRALSHEVDSERLVAVLLRLLVQDTGARRAVLFAVQEGGLTPMAGTELKDNELAVENLPAQGWQSEVAEKALNYVNHTRESLVVGDAPRDERLAADPFVIGSHVKSILCVPVLHQSTLEGILYLDNDLVTDAFTSYRLTLVETLANQAAISLNNANLFLRIQRESGQRHEAEARLRAVASGTAGAVGRDFFRDLVWHLARALTVRIAFVTECADSTQTRARALAFVDRGRFMDDVEYELDGTPCKDVIDGNVCFYSDRLEHRFPKEKGLVSYLGVPMHGSDGDILGHLAVVDDKPLIRDKDNELLLRIFATRAGTELERQRAQDTAERSRRGLEEKKRLASIGQFASMIVHEIRSPLSTIGMALDYLHRIELPEGAVKRMRLAAEEKGRLEDLMNEILLFAKPQQLTIESLDLDHLLRKTIETECGVLAEEPPRIDYVGLSKPVCVNGDGDKLKQVVINLLSNAHQAIAADQTVTVTLAMDSGSENVQVQVSNPGHIPKENLMKLTEPFFTTKSHGTGLGLAVVKRIVEAHEGELRISSDDTGVCVTVSIPSAATEGQRSS